MFLLNLNEIDRVKKLHHVSSLTALARLTGLSRKTWTTAIGTRRPTISVLNALSDLGADPARIIVREGVGAEMYAA
ncbi:helix-turn-helix domain-containing protein [Corynebacterium renale]|uniref:helix-turn-helix domain-containing protein n=1 Tax=Corynebacterium renale TaxID=1724 RepID=UPI000E00AA50|nr:XRE family transcriptional regulator [Corynebacterium renale]STC97757.1 Uncharacterised protein [Corynebacterium renale]STD70259.1 Uncharacterised protein [Corynebacterium renale]